LKGKALNVARNLLLKLAERADMIPKVLPGDPYPRSTFAI